jgi:hypothetical protein
MFCHTNAHRQHKTTARNRRRCFMSARTHHTRQFPFVALCVSIVFLGTSAASWAQSKPPSLLPHIVRVDHKTYGTYGNGYVYAYEGIGKNQVAYAFFSYDCPERLRNRPDQCAQQIDRHTTVTFPYEHTSYDGTIIAVYCHITVVQRRIDTKCKKNNQHLRIGIVRFHIGTTERRPPTTIGNEAYDYRGRIPFCTQTKRSIPFTLFGFTTLPFLKQDTEVFVCTSKQGWIMTTLDGTRINRSRQEMEQIRNNIIGYPAYDSAMKKIVGMYLGKPNAHVIPLRNTAKIIRSKPPFAHLLFYEFSCFAHDQCDRSP